MVVLLVCCSVLKVFGCSGQHCRRAITYVAKILVNSTACDAPLG